MVKEGCERIEITNLFNKLRSSCHKLLACSFVFKLLIIRVLLECSTHVYVSLYRLYDLYYFTVHVDYCRLLPRPIASSILAKVALARTFAFSAPLSRISSSSEELISCSYRAWIGAKCSIITCATEALKSP
jgi:hypothetical protein